MLGIFEGRVPVHENFVHSSLLKCSTSRGIPVVVPFERKEFGRHFNFLQVALPFDAAAKTLKMSERLPTGLFRSYWMTTSKLTCRVSRLISKLLDAVAAISVKWLWSGMWSWSCDATCAVLVNEPIGPFEEQVTRQEVAIDGRIVSDVVIDIPREWQLAHFFPRNLVTRREEVQWNKMERYQWTPSGPHTRPIFTQLPITGVLNVFRSLGGPLRFNSKW